MLLAASCVRRAQEARLQSLAMQLAESDCTLRVTNTHLCSADSARAKKVPQGVGHGDELVFGGGWKMRQSRLDFRLALVA